MMGSNILVIVGTIVIPSVVIFSVCVLTFVNLYLNIRRRFPAQVNCWFCNTNARVPYDQSNSFICPTCRQYNGFGADGDYNREIPEQYQHRLNNYCYHQPANVTDDDKWGISARSISTSNNRTPHNGLCFGCNRNQELKIHQLASFVPENEDNYDIEVDEYRKQLEQAYKLCGRCERVLKRTLNDVKRNILGSKLAQIGSKSLKVLDMHMRASTKQLAQLKRRQWGKMCVYAVSGLLLTKLPQELVESGWTVAELMLHCPPSLLTGIMMMLSYALAMKQLVWQQFEKLLSEPAVQQTTERVEMFGNELLQEYAPQLLQTSTQFFESFSKQVPTERTSSFLLNGAIVALAALLAFLGSNRTALKQMLIIAVSLTDCIVKYTQYPVVLPSYLLTLAALGLTLSCIGQRVVRSDVSGSDMNSSFHKIYSQQCSETDYSDVDTTANSQQSPVSFRQNSAAKNLADDSMCHQPTVEPLLPAADAAADLSRKSLDTTKSGSISLSPTNSFFMNSSKMSGSLFNVAEVTQPRLEKVASVFGQGNSSPSAGSLLKAPSFSVENFQNPYIQHHGRWNNRKNGTTSMASGRHGQFRYSMSTINQEADAFQEGGREPLIEDDIDRLSISGRVSINNSPRAINVSHVSLSNGNPFAHMKPSKDELDYEEASSSLRQRRLVRHRPEHFTVSRESLWPGLLATGSGIVDAVQQIQMSRTSSQSSGFESQVETTRRNTPTEGDILSVYTTPEVAQLETSEAPPSPVPSSASVFHNQQSAGMNSSHSLFGEQNLFNHALQQPAERPLGLFFPKLTHHPIANSGSASAAASVTRHIFPPKQSQTPSYHHHFHQHQQNHNLAGIGGGSQLSLHSNSFGTTGFPGNNVPTHRSSHLPPSLAGTNFYTSNQSTATLRASLLNLSKLGNELTNAIVPTG